MKATKKEMKKWLHESNADFKTLCADKKHTGVSEVSERERYLAHLDAQMQKSLMQVEQKAYVQKTINGISFRRFKNSFRNLIASLRKFQIEFEIDATEAGILWCYIKKYSQAKMVNGIDEFNLDLWLEFNEGEIRVGVGENEVGAFELGNEEVVPMFLLNTFRKKADTGWIVNKYKPNAVSSDYQMAMEY